MEKPFVEAVVGIRKIALFINHANQTFDQEYLKFLKCHHIQYDERFVH